MKIICLGNYPPRQCGIATFTENVVTALESAAKASSLTLEIEVIAMNDVGQSYNYPAIVTKVIRDQHQEDYIKAAAYINASNADICIVEHEYGIFGGNSGLMLISLLRKLTVPVVTIFHSVLQKPNFHQKEVLKKIAAYSSGIIVMSKLAIHFLKEVFEVPAAKIFLVEHGVPDFEDLKSIVPNSPAHWKGKKVMMTFGLIGRSKGIETAIKALPSIVEKHKDLLYVIIGKTHPHVVRHEGEAYRDSLKQLVSKLELDEHVEFMDEYLSEKQLVSCLLAADLYVTPYHNKAQITSGTLCYALGGGCAVFSTAYWHAEEVLQNGTGRLFEFGDWRDLSKQINEVLDDPNLLSSLKQNAYEYGKKISWPLISNKYLRIFKNLASIANHHEIHLESQYQLIDYPFNLQHIIRLTDDVGILQHAIGCTPNFKAGYCLDDNARALLLSMMSYRQFKEPKYLQITIKYLSYINHMQNKDGSFKNFMTFTHETFENDESDDATGRTIWALGYLIRHAPNDSIFQLAMEIFHRAIGQIKNMNHKRGFANCILGLHHYIRRFPDQDKFIMLMDELATKICDGYDEFSKDNWKWFEPIISYDNGLLPASLYRAYEITGKERFLEIADASTQFLESKCFSNEHLSLIGSNRWLKMDEDYELYAQQPIDAMAMVVLYNCMYRIKKDAKTAEKLRNSFKWFLGFNDHDLPLYDIETCGCNDGIEEFSINRNQGAESTIAYHIAWLVAAPYFEIELKAVKAILSVDNFVYRA
ncbi:MAG: glycosyltransferase [Bacteroidetes bacterium]|nr:glycosyltransferase [Bacteroidota bacterium]